jgi:hypothetical protein
VHIEGGWFADERPFAMGFHARFAHANMIYRGNRLIVESGSSSTPVALSQVDPYAEQLRYFVNCCRSHSEPTESPASAGADAVYVALTVRSLAHSMPGVLTPFTHIKDSDLGFEQ